MPNMPAITQRKECLDEPGNVRANRFARPVAGRSAGAAADGRAERTARGRQRNIRTIALEVLREPVFLPLLSAGIIYLPRGDVSDALMLLAMPWLREIFHFTPITPQQFALCIAGPGSVLWFELYKFFRRH
jgi:hypothetical protein